MPAVFLGAFNAGTTATLRLPTFGPGISLIVFAGNGVAQSATLTVADDLGNSYASRGTINDTNNGATRTLLDCIVPTTTGSPTLTLSGGGASPQLIVLMYAGLGSFSSGSFSSVFVAAPTNSTDGIATASITPTSYPAVILAGGLMSAAGPVSPGTGFTQRYKIIAGLSNGDFNFDEEKRLLSGSSIASFTNASASSVAVIAAAYIEAVGAAPVNQQRRILKKRLSRQGGLVMGLNLLEWF